MDVVAGRPLPQGNKVNLEVVYRFSKACHLIPLPKLPSAPQTAEIVLQSWAFPKMWFQTVVLSLHPGSGRPSASLLGLQPVYHLGFIPSLMDRLK